jgi:hypothetical protein
MQYNIAQLDEKSFKNLVYNFLEDFLKNWEMYFENYFETIVLEGYDVDYLKVSINGQNYVIENEEDFIKVLKKLYGDLGQRLLQMAKKEIIK